VSRHITGKTSQCQEATSVLQCWRQATDTTLEQLLRTETSGSLETTVIKDQYRSKRGCQQASTLQTSNDVQSSIPSLPISHGDRVLTQFTDGKWYAGNIHGDYPKGHSVLFDGYESYRASKIDFHQIKPYITVNETFTSVDQVSSGKVVQISLVVKD
jgi:hypothetical protein